MAPDLWDILYYRIPKQRRMVLHHVPCEILTREPNFPAVKRHTRLRPFNNLHMYVIYDNVIGSLFTYLTL
jgi:hypothetical protein